MNEEMINHVLSRMSDHLDNSQMIKLRNTLEESLQNEERAPDKSSAERLDQFIATKRLEGRSAKPLTSTVSLSVNSGRTAVRTYA